MKSHAVGVDQSGHCIQQLLVNSCLGFHEKEEEDEVKEEEEGKNEEEGEEPQ